MTAKITPDEIPDWLAGLPKKSLVSAKDFALALGVAMHTFKNRVRRGVGIPEPYTRKFNTHNNFDGPRCEVRYWKAVTVRNYIRKLIRENQE